MEGRAEFEDKEAGFSFKPKGLMQFDAGYVGYPNGDELRGTVGGLNYQQPRLQHPRPPHRVRRRRHHAGRLQLQGRVQLRAGHGRL